ncbi:nuclear transport factor 2 family protein [Herbiconiux sp. CPCC 203407]|uniref:Nuclear transport factor 2 family protein n=1 Tax=Herbiconiux oxytropis TaxID=2970915 RepID=A0AA41XG18_9MICO|nr:nuclear transport factor 2 family protein [Herbiconiux oxytropis]MCS5721826.1 nuclear transport factor 2 family protein [Herbiconiux oxytropis]MCS5727352.1 nuclear transport factor 2 family protein [Herbiconiux oxytropis]
MTEITDIDVKSRQLAMQFYDYFCTFDPAVYEHLVEPDAYYKVGHAEYFGHEGFANVAKVAKFVYPNGLTPEITDVIVEGYKVALKVTTRAVTNKGLDYENFYAVHFRFSENGKVAELNEFPDTAYALEKFSHEGIEDLL